MVKSFKFLFFLFFLTLFLCGCGGGASNTSTAILPTPVPSLSPIPSSTPGGSDVTWTVMIYMNGNSSLESITDLKLEELSSLNSTSSVNIVVQQAKLSQKGRACRYYINGTKELMEEFDVIDMSSAEALNDFVRWGKKEFPADHYILNIFTHSGGWRGLLRDEVSGNVMDISQLEQALKGEDIDILSFSSCLMNNLEVAYQLKDACHILISSEDDVPVSGWPYSVIWTSLIENPRQTPSDFSKEIVRLYVDYYNNAAMTNMTISSLNLDEVHSLVNYVKNFSDIIVSRKDLWESVKEDRLESLLFYNKNYIDTGGFFSLIEINSNYPPEIIGEAREINYSLENFVIAFNKTSGSTKASGVALYFPEDASVMYDFNNNKYSSLAFGKYNYNWENFLLKLYD